MLVDSMQVMAESEALIVSRQKEQMLGQLARGKTEFLHQMAHELRTPLAVMSGYTQMSGWELERAGNNAEVVENMRLISNEAQRLSKIVERLTEIAGGKEVQTEFSLCAVGQLFETVRNICAPVCLKNKNVIAISVAGDLFVWGNFELLLQVLINLVVNANKHVSGSIITFAAQMADDFVVIDVIDGGTGISPDARANLFERGYSTDGGDGIGLSLCKEIVTLHGGTIEVCQSRYLICWAKRLNA